MKHGILVVGALEPVVRYPWPQVMHVMEPDVFLHEIARVRRSHALFSVPNMEILPYLHEWGVVPCHLLEGDHKNFFTRASLRLLTGRSQDCSTENDEQFYTG